MPTPNAPLPLPTFDKPVRLLIVVAPYHRDISEALLIGALAVARKAGVEIEELEVPSVQEIAPAIAMAERMADFHGYVALGCMIRGETSHYDLVCTENARALTALSLGGACVGQGVLTVESHGQAVTRANPDGQDKGGEATAAALHLIAISRKWAGQTKGIGFRA